MTLFVDVTVLLIQIHVMQMDLELPHMFLVNAVINQYLLVSTACKIY